MLRSPRRRQGLLFGTALLLPLLVSGLQGPVSAQLDRAAVAALAPQGQAGPTVRVLLATGSRWDLSGPGGGLRLRDARGQVLAELDVSERLLLRAAGSSLALELIDPQGFRRSVAPPSDGVVWIEPAAAADGQGLVGLGTERYRGRLQIRPSGSGELQVINHLPLEHYLPSVVGSEMPASWPQAALRAQAVAARTYALSQLRPASSFDLKASVASQVYRGVAGESSSTREAVLATRGEVLMQNGQLIQAVFHSSSGGVTEDSGQVWSRQLPYLVSVPDFDQNAPVSRWQLRLEPDQLRRLFRETDGVRRIDVLASSGSGRIRRARVIGPAGALELSGTELRQRLGLRSTLVTFQLQPVAGVLGSAVEFSGNPVLPPGGSGVIGRAVRQAQLLSSQRSGAAAEGSIAAEAGTAMVVDSATGLLMPAPAPRPLPPSSRPSAEPAAPPPILPPVGLAAGPGPSSPAMAYALVVDGRGFGHGVGMSQWGAHAMALQGHSYGQILRHYYRGVELLPYRAP